MKTTKVTVRDIQMGKLRPERFDVLYILGGSVSNYYYALGAYGHDAIRRFVSEGGGYVGICAGAYLGSGCIE